MKDVSPHTLRNNFARRFLMAGGDIYTLSGAYIIKETIVDNLNLFEL